MESDIVLQQGPCGETANRNSDQNLAKTSPRAVFVLQDAVRRWRRSKQSESSDDSQGLLNRENASTTGFDSAFFSSYFFGFLLTTVSYVRPPRRHVLSTTREIDTLRSSWLQDDCLPSPFKELRHRACGNGIEFVWCASIERRRPLALTAPCCIRSLQLTGLGG